MSAPPPPPPPGFQGGALPPPPPPGFTLPGVPPALAAPLAPPAPPAAPAPPAPPAPPAIDAPAAQRAPPPAPPGFGGGRAPLVPADILLTGSSDSTASAPLPPPPSSSLTSAVTFDGDNINSGNNNNNNNNVIPGSPSSPRLPPTLSRESLEQLGDETEDFLEVEHALSTYMGSVLFEELSVFSISNANVEEAFRMRTRDIFVVDCWVPLETLGANNSPMRLYERGFRFDKGALGFEFVSGGRYAGNVPIKTYKAPYGSKDAGGGSKSDAGPRLGDGRIELVLCSVGIGRSHVVATEEELQNKHIPPDCDSVFVGEMPSIDALLKGDTGLAYRMFDPLQVWPRYLVQFAMEPSNHQRLPMDRSASSSGKNASPSTSSTLSKENGASSPPSSPTPSKLQEDTYGTINAHMEIIDEALGVLHQTENPEDMIYALTKETLLALQEEAQHKMNRVIGAEFELRRQMCEIQNSIRFFDHHRRVSRGPGELLKMLSHPGKHMMELFGEYAAASPKALDIQADLSVNGKLSVVPIVEERRLERPGPKGRGGSSPIKAASIDGIMRATRASGMAAPTDMDEPNIFRTTVGDPMAPQHAHELHSTAFAADPATAAAVGQVLTVDAGVEANTQLASRPKFKRNSLEVIANRKARNMDAETLESMSLPNCKLLRDEGQRRKIFVGLPDAEHAVATKIFEWDGRGTAPTVGNLVQATVGHTETLMLFKTSSNVLFGGYADASWETLSKFQRSGGTRSSFLFSVTHDVMLPFHVRTGVADSKRQKEHDSALFVDVFKKWKQVMCWGSPPEGGKKKGRSADFQINGSLDTCSSCVEQSYGMNMPAADGVRDTFLGGATEFAIVFAEIWTIRRGDDMNTFLECQVFDGETVDGKVGEITGETLPPPPPPGMGESAAPPPPAFNSVSAPPAPPEIGGTPVPGPPASAASADAAAPPLPLPSPVPPGPLSISSPLELATAAAAAAAAAPAVLDMSVPAPQPALGASEPLPPPPAPPPAPGVSEPLPSLPAPPPTPGMPEPPPPAPPMPSEDNAPPPPPLIMSAAEDDEPPPPPPMPSEDDAPPPPPPPPSMLSDDDGPPLPPPLAFDSVPAPPAPPEIGGTPVPGPPSSTASADTAAPPLPLPSPIPPGPPSKSSPLAPAAAPAAAAPAVPAVPAVLDASAPAPLQAPGVSEPLPSPPAPPPTPGMPEPPPPAPPMPSEDNAQPPPPLIMSAAEDDEPPPPPPMPSEDDAPPPPPPPPSMLSDDDGPPLPPPLAFDSVPAPPAPPEIGGTLVPEPPSSTASADTAAPPLPLPSPIPPGPPSMSSPLAPPAPPPAPPPAAAPAVPPVPAVLDASAPAPPQAPGASEPLPPPPAPPPAPGVSEPPPPPPLQPMQP